MARTNRRYSGKKVISARGTINVNTDHKSGMKTRIPKPNTASKATLPRGVCAKDTTAGKVSMRGISRNSARPFAFAFANPVCVAIPLIV